jgi:hypothetical protein
MDNLGHVGRLLVARLVYVEAITWASEVVAIGRRPYKCHITSWSERRPGRHLRTGDSRWLVLEPQSLIVSARVLISRPIVSQRGCRCIGLHPKRGRSRSPHHWSVMCVAASQACSKTELFRCSRFPFRLRRRTSGNAPRRFRALSGRSAVWRKRKYPQAFGSELDRLSGSIDM